MVRRVTIIVIGWTAVFPGCGPAGSVFTDYHEGYNQGVREVREARKDGGVMAEFGMQAANSLGFRPSDDTKSADWNAGYQRGAKDELAK